MKIVKGDGRDGFSVGESEGRVTEDLGAGREESWKKGDLYLHEAQVMAPGAGTAM